MPFRRIDEDTSVEMHEAQDKTLATPKLIVPSLQENMRAGKLSPKNAQCDVFMKAPIKKL